MQYAIVSGRSATDFGTFKEEVSLWVKHVHVSSCCRTAADELQAPQAWGNAKAFTQAEERSALLPVIGGAGAQLITGNSEASAADKLTGSLLPVSLS